MDRWVRWGVPFHIAAHGRQEERPDLRTFTRRLAAGETLFLVQPHEYMPRLRRFMHRVSGTLGFLGRPAHSFLFRVDRGGVPAMPMHDDGDSDLLWLQLDGERFVRFGTPDAKGRLKAVHAADGHTSGWFEGPLPAGSLLYLPPRAPHHVGCRKPSLALSIYWEPCDLAAETCAWLALVTRFGQSRQARSVRGLLAASVRATKQPLFRLFQATQRTFDDAKDRPPRLGELHPETQIAAWRCFELLQTGRRLAVVAGYDIHTLPCAAAPALGLLAGYGEASYEKLITARGRLSRLQLDRLLYALNRAGLLGPGPLPAMVRVEPHHLTGFEYFAHETGLGIHRAPV